MGRTVEGPAAGLVAGVVRGMVADGIRGFGCGRPFPKLLDESVGTFFPGATVLSGVEFADAVVEVEVDAFIFVVG